MSSRKRSGDYGEGSERARVRSMTEFYALEVAEDAAQAALTAKESGDCMAELKQALVAVIFAQIAIEGYFHSFLEEQLLHREADYEEVMGIPRLEERIERGVQLTTGKAVAQGCQPYQDFQLLKDIRNALVHYKPVWEGSEGSSSDVLRAAESQNRFSLNRDRARWDEKVLTASCAEWACRTSVAVVRYICDLGSIGGYPHGIADRLNHYGL